MCAAPQTIAINASVVKAVATMPAANCPPPSERARRDQRERADAQRERRQPDERGQQTPEDEENADEVNMGDIESDNRVIG